MIAAHEMQALSLDNLDPVSPSSLEPDVSSGATTTMATPVGSDSETASDTRPQDLLLELVSTPDRGLALFTTRKIKAGTLILAEQPLISLDKDEEDDPDAIEREFSRLPRSEHVSRRLDILQQLLQLRRLQGRWTRWISHWRLREQDQS